MVPWWSGEQWITLGAKNLEFAICPNMASELWFTKYVQEQPAAGRWPDRARAEHIWSPLVRLDSGRNWEALQVEIVLNEKNWRPWRVWSHENWKKGEIVFGHKSSLLNKVCWRQLHRGWAAAGNSLANSSKCRHIRQDWNWIFQRNRLQPKIVW